MKMTITEALAEIKTIDKRLQKKVEFVGQYVALPSMLKDPLAKQGGAAAVVAETLQSVSDLQRRKTGIRLAVQEANVATELSIGSRRCSVAEWIIWRREVSGQEMSLLRGIQQQINRARQQMLERKGSVQPPVTPEDIAVAVDEKKPADDIEHLEDVLGQLDGKLSLKNATVLVDV